MIQNTTLLTRFMRKLLGVKSLAKVYFIIKWIVLIPCLGSCGPSPSSPIEHKNSKTCFAQFSLFFFRLFLDFFSCFVNSDWPFPPIWEEPFVTRLVGEFYDAFHRSIGSMYASTHAYRVWKLWISLTTSSQRRSEFGT